jgi:hypothetical protein
MPELPANFHLFGVRHHGPGCARLLARELAELQPDCLLIEGPPDADALLAFANQPSMKPPVALLVYATDNPRQASFYPMAEFSPEWQAIRWAATHAVPTRFMDLPQRFQLGVAESGAEEEAPDEPSPESRDPLGTLAQAAGLDDGEEWWERLVEQRESPTEVFPAIAEAMASLREGSGMQPSGLREARREAWMRETMRAALKEGFQKIAVVCGAWHEPALAAWPKAADDKAILAKLPKTNVSATWVPWSYSRLATASGYGAGVASPGFYDFLWHNKQEPLAVGWLVKVAGLLREKDIDCSSAHLIETVRLADTLAAIRQRRHPGLAELNEAVRSVICLGDDAQLSLIRKELIVGERLGTTPDGTPEVPLMQSLRAEQKRLRMKPEAVVKTLDLDLRKPNDLERSHLLHRLTLLGIHWGERATHHTGKGTFHELWQLEWEPEFAITVVEAAQYGQTVEDAASSKTADTAAKADSIGVVAGLAEQVLLANLPAANAAVVSKLESLAATTGAVTELMAAVPALVNIARYGNVRQTDTSQLLPVLDSMVTRLCIGLPSACLSLDDDAAAAMHQRVAATHSALKLLANEEHSASWARTTRHLADMQGLHGLLAGACARRLLDENLEEDSVSWQRMSYALSVGADPSHAAAWLEGFLQGSGMILLHDERLFSAIDTWLAGLSGEEFVRLLPLLRRTFSKFPSGERRQIGERVKAPVKNATSTAEKSEVAAWDTARADLLAPVLKQILGL